MLAHTLLASSWPGLNSSTDIPILRMKHQNRTWISAPFLFFESNLIPCMLIDYSLRLGEHPYSAHRHNESTPRARKTAPLREPP
jgi:hypothetical protein